jgi:hypothetical protein
MLLQIDTDKRLAIKARSVRLAEFGLDERGLQDILFRALDRLIPDDELLLIMQSRHWREEPDLMAVDASGVNYRFMSTMFSIDAEAGRKLDTVIRSRKKK